MSAAIDLLNPAHPKRVLILVSNPAVSAQTGWNIGFWWAELSHPFWEFTENGYAMDIASPDGGTLQADSWSDPGDASGYSVGDLISNGFIHTPNLMAQVTASKSLQDVALSDYDALFLVGGQAPMYTYYNDARVHKLVADFYESGKITAVVCHATCVLLKATLSTGKLLVDGKTWTGFANAEEEFADAFVGQKIQPFWIEDEARKIQHTNFAADFSGRGGNVSTLG